MIRAVPNQDTRRARTLRLPPDVDETIDSLATEHDLDRAEVAAAAVRAWAALPATERTRAARGIVEAREARREAVARGAAAARWAKR